MEESKKKKRNKKNKGKNSSVDYPNRSPELSTQAQADVKFASSVSVSESEGDSEKLKVYESKVEGDSSGQAAVEELIKDLRAGIISFTEKEVSLKNEIGILRQEADLFRKNEINWNLKVEQLEGEMSYLSAKEASLDRRLASIESNKESTDFQKTMELMLSRLEEIDSALQRQVKEAEVAKVNHAEENQVLSDKISLLETRLMYLESEAAAYFRPPASESHQSDVAKEMSEMPLETPSSPMIETINITSADSKEIFPGMPQSPDGLKQSPEIEEIFPGALQSSDGLKPSPEIVQIPLNDRGGDHGGQPQFLLTSEVKVTDMKPVPLTDAPLIGAPFRLISFVAKYVSGTDLVQEKPQNSMR
ncbi:mitochondrial ATP synthase D chain-related protein [Wolffia australiana]